MLSRTERGCLILADISGYTAYLTGSELTHAQDVLADLIGVVLGSVRPILKLNKLEGDAAFLTAPQGTVDGPLLIDVVEQCYFKFQRRLRDIRQATTCQCNACLRIPSLNLKFFAHEGEFARQRIAGRDELAGSDVILVHRLLKNTIADSFGVQGYAVLTAACVDALALDPAGLGLRPHSEQYEHIGTVPVFVHNLEARWTAEQDRRRAYIGPGKGDIEVTAEIPAPPAVVWDYLTSPTKRLRYTPGATGMEQRNPAGRRGPGTTNHCAHGADVIVEEVMDWRPFDYFTVRFTIMGVTIQETCELSASGHGTRVTLRPKVGRSKKARDAWAQMRDMYSGLQQQLFANLRSTIAEDGATSVAVRPG
jgi:uncharacterized protein YndB with AHSA1/START domain